MQRDCTSVVSVAVAVLYSTFISLSFSVKGRGSAMLVVCSLGHNGF